MRIRPLSIGSVLVGCALVATTSCSPDESKPDVALGPSLAATAVSAYDIVKVDSTRMTVDGNLSDWGGITAISIADDPANGRGGLNNSANVKLAWNSTYLYVAYDVTDSELLTAQTARDAINLYKDDAVELYIDPQGDGAGASTMTLTDYHVLTNVLEILGDSRGTGGSGQDATFNATSFVAQAVANGTVNASGADVGYAVEMRVKWADFGITAPVGGTFMRIDVGVDDRDGTTPTDQYFDWANLSNFNNPGGWKDVQLVNQGPAGISAYDIVKVGTAMSIDGNLADWAGIAAISMADDSTNGRAAGLNNSAKVKLAWDPTYLYAAYDVTDTELLTAQTTRDAVNLFLDDAVELYVDPQGDGAGTSRMTTTDYHVLANVLEILGDSKGNGAGGQDATFNAISYVAKAIANGAVNASGTDVGYAVELRVKWADFGITAPVGGTFMRMDPAVDDRDGATPIEAEFDWANLSNFNNPDGWKDVRLVVDNTVPAGPTNLALTVVSSSRIDLAWTGSTSADVAKYKIYRGTTATPALLTTVSGSPYQNTGLTAGTSYTYQVSAVDAAGNESPKTASVTATTPSTVPGGAIGTAPRNGTLFNIANNPLRTTQYQGGVKGSPNPGDNAGLGPDSFPAGSRIEAGTTTSLTTWTNRPGDPLQAAFTITRIGIHNDISWHGGYVKGSSLEDGSVNWASGGGVRAYHDQTAFAWDWGLRGLIEHFSAYNKGDGVGLGYGNLDRTTAAAMNGRDGMVIRYSAIEGMGDDAIENDLKDSIVVYRNYLSGVVIVSSRPASSDISQTTDTRNKVMTFDGNLCWLRPKRFADSRPRTVDGGVQLNQGDPGVFNFWKWQRVNPTYAMKVVLKNNILRYDETAQHEIPDPAGGFKVGWTGNVWGSLLTSNIASQSNNVVLFPNRASGLPGAGWPTSGLSGFSYIYGNAAKARWNMEIRAWMAAHPEVKVTDPGLFPGF